jgi:hypothetical protein
MDQEQTRLDGFPTRPAKADSDWTLAAARAIVSIEIKSGYAPVDLIQEIIQEYMEPQPFDLEALELQVAAGGSVDIPGRVDTLIITTAEGSTINVQNNVHELAIEQGSGGQVIFANGAAEATIIQGPGSVIQYNREKP